MAARSFHNYTKRRLYRAENRERGGNHRGTRAEQDAAAEPSEADVTAQVLP